MLQHHITLASALQADSLPLQKQLSAQAGLYTVLPVHAVWQEVQAGRESSACPRAGPALRHRTCSGAACVNGSEWE